MANISDKDLIRIEKLLEVSRSSDFPGEAENALAAAKRIAAEAGFDLDELMSGTRRQAEEKLAEGDPERTYWNGWPGSQSANKPYVQFTTVMYAAEQAAKLARDRERAAAEARARASEKPAPPNPGTARKKKGDPMPDLSSAIIKRYKQKLSRIRRTKTV